MLRLKIKEIAIFNGLSYNYMRRTGMSRRISNKKRELLQLKNNIIEAYYNGGSLKQVALWYDSSASAIRTLLVEEGVELRNQGRQPKEK